MRGGRGDGSGGEGLGISPARRGEALGHSLKL